MRLDWGAGWPLVEILLDQPGLWAEGCCCGHGAPLSCRRAVRYASVRAHRAGVREPSRDLLVQATARAWVTFAS